mgnify:CR=1 FL=1
MKFKVLTQEEIEAGHPWHFWNDATRRLERLFQKDVRKGNATQEPLAMQEKPEPLANMFFDDPYVVCTSVSLPESGPWYKVTAGAHICTGRNSPPTKRQIATVLEEIIRELKYDAPAT